MIPPTSIDGTDITGATIDGTDVQEITVDGDVVFTAAPDIIDDFESGNLNAYNRTSGFQISNFAAKGNHSLEFNNAPFDSPNNETFIGMYSVPGDGLANYFAKGEKMSYLWYAENNGFHGVNFGVNSTGTEGVLFTFKASDSTLSLITEQNGSTTRDDFLASGDYRFEWLEVEIQWHDGSGSQPNNTITADIFQTNSNFQRTNLINSGSITESRFSNNQGIGYADRLRDAHTDIYIDHVVNLGPVD